MQLNYTEQMRDLLNKAIDLYGLKGVHPAADLLPFMDEESFNELVKDAEENGFLHPARITDDDLLIDGRNRVCASILLEKDVRLERYNPVDPIQYVLSENVKRRHLNSKQLGMVAVDAEELYASLAEKAKEKQREAGKLYGEKHPKQEVSQKIEQPLKTESPNERKTDTKIAKTYGTNRDYVSKAKKVKQYAPELKEDVKSGKVDLLDAVKVADQRKKQEKSIKAESSSTSKEGLETVSINGYTLHIWHKEDVKSGFNQSNEAIDWAWSTWNPVTGCLHTCSYCYARDIALNERFKAAFPKGFEPVFHPYRLNAPKYQRNFTEEEIIRKANERKLDPDLARNIWAKNVFVCSMADLFGKWVPDEWILQVFESVVKYNQWNYLFLTKYPQRLQEIGKKLGGYFPSNCWVGTTVDEQKRVKTAQDAFANINAPVKWLSLEPLLTNLEFTDLGMFDMVAIGGQSSNSQVSAFQPQWEWVENIIWQARKSGTAVYFKENLTCRPKELPF